MSNTSATAIADAASPTVSESEPSISRIAICSVGELFGGVERHILGLMRGLQARGVEPVLLLFHDRELASQARDQGVTPVLLPDRNWSMLAAATQMAELLIRKKIGIVHVHGYKAMICAALARRKHPVVIVKTEHGLPEPMAGRPVLALRERLYRSMDAWVTRATDTVVCYVSADLMAHYRKQHAGLRHAVVANGISIGDARGSSRPPEFRQDRFNVAVVGRLDTVKGHHVAIEALARIGKQEPRVELFFIGTGPCESQLKALAVRRGVASRIHFLGFQRNIYDFIAHCDTLLMPSLHEGLPYTLLEAMALGAPIVASRVGGLAAVLQDGRSGVLVPPGDVSALASAVTEILGNLELRRRLGAYAQQVQQSRYSLAVMTDQYLEVYRTLGSQGKNPDWNPGLER